jgi:cytochrome c oxidase assembly protein subunit 15
MLNGTSEMDESTTAGRAVLPPVRSRGSGYSLSDRLRHLYALFLFGCVTLLVCSGGLVTSKGAGLAVPDWPNTYGYNMFAFPISRWTGGIFYEHTHRLIASGVGMLTIGLAVWLWRTDGRRWMRWLGVAALAAVILQGVLGGVRVLALKDEIGIFHACLAQAFLALIGFIALALSKWWKTAGRMNQPHLSAETVVPLRTAFMVLAGLIYLQLALGATMRHEHAGLSIRDFPAAYGKVWPPTDQESIARINRERDEVLHLPPTSAVQIVLQMCHRIGAALVAAGALWTAWLAWRSRRVLSGGLLSLGMLGPGLIAVQITLGIYTIWTNKAADIATAHVAVGALSLVWAVLFIAALGRWAEEPSLRLQTIETPMSRQPLPLSEAAV